jgi:hypothetical protein
LFYIPDNVLSVLERLKVIRGQRKYTARSRQHASGTPKENTGVACVRGPAAVSEIGEVSDFPSSSSREWWAIVSYSPLDGDGFSLTSQTN